MLGAIIGDIVGSPFEFDRGGKTTDFELFSADSDYTDDTVMTLAVGQALLDAAGDESRAEAAVIARMRDFARQYPLPPRANRRTAGRSHRAAPADLGASPLPSARPAACE